MLVVYKRIDYWLWNVDACVSVCWHGLCVDGKYVWEKSLCF